MNAAKPNTREGGASFSPANRAIRACWLVTWAIFASWTPPSFYRWRRFLLVCFGARLAPLCDVRGTAKVWYPANLVMGHRALIGPRANCYNMATVTLEDYALVSQGAHLCAGNHDIDDVDFTLTAKPITLRAHSWVAADAFVGPGVVIGEGAVLGARGAAFRDLEPWTLYIGNPATVRRRRKKLTSSASDATDAQSLEKK